MLSDSAHLAGAELRDSVELRLMMHRRKKVLLDQRAMTDQPARQSVCCAMNADSVEDNFGVAWWHSGGEEWSVERLFRCDVKYVHHHRRRSVVWLECEPFRALHFLV